MVDIVIGLQYGSESKGLVAVELAKNNKYDYAVTTNSCQSGHTSYFLNENGEKIKVINRQLPSSFPYVDKIILTPGAMIKPHILKEEIEFLESIGFTDIRSKLIIDPMSGITEDDDGEKEGDLVNRIASTGEGVGYSWSKRVMRSGRVVGDDIEFFSQFGEIKSTYEMLNDTTKNILLEGSQGFGLSLFHSYYPTCTSRDTSTMALLSAAGISFRNVRDVYGVIRTFPIRVGSTKNTSGHMKDELSWDDVTKISGYTEQLVERTTVTGRVRRIARFDEDQVKKAIQICGVNKLCLTFLNYVDHTNEKINKYEELPISTIGFISHIEDVLNMSIDYVSTNRYNMFKTI